jgi:hypothetical protein
MKMDRQIAVLAAIGRLSGPRKEPVSGDQLSRALGDVAPATVILSNKFLADAGWIVPSGRGFYAATDELVEYARRLATGPTDDATQALRAPARRSWFWGVLEPYLANGGRLPANEASILLMREADAMDHHMPAIQNLIAWLVYIGLIAKQNNYIVAVDSSDVAATPPAELPVQPLPPARPEPKGSPDPVDEGPIVQGEQAPPRVLIALGVDVLLTVDDLARLTPEQITAFFAAVGTLAALKNTAQG